MGAATSVHFEGSRNSAGAREAGENPAQPRYCKRGGPIEDATVSATEWEGRPVRRCASQETGRRVTVQLSWEERRMRICLSGIVACCLLFSAGLSAAQVKGQVVDPSG